ncbi:MAG TPA: DNA mismatch repair endonuclease MutL, partial [Clostridia bacterium]|nr:DNA mismatch repair endonuclease MutL [Clostridia bacterium]
MGVIEILDKDTSSRIAAGEVVERPSSVVKELIENSIDANSTSISVEIKGGGCKYIRITDNGDGIMPEDVAKAFMRHATSKIRSGHDLMGINTLGFRGEALPSIAAVSDFEMYTRTPNSEYGYHIRLKAGEIAEEGEYGCPEGTTVIVRDLFYNTPARLKFLKNKSIEAGYVAEITSRLSLANPGISFKLKIDGVARFHTPGDGYIDNGIRAIYGQNIASQLLPVEHDENGIYIKGFIGKPEIAKPNRTFQTLVVNGRFVSNALVSSVVSDALRNYMMVNKFPFFVLHLRLDPVNLDVNVHPSKYEIKFSNKEAVQRAVYNAVARAYKQYTMPNLFADTVQNNADNRINKPKDTYHISIAPPDYPYRMGDRLEFCDRPSLITPQIVLEEKKEPIAQKSSAKSVREAVQADIALETDASTRIIGQLFSTYIIVEKEDC